MPKLGNGFLATSPLIRVSQEINKVIKNNDAALMSFASFVDANVGQLIGVKGVLNE